MKQALLVFLSLFFMALICPAAEPVIARTVLNIPEVGKMPNSIAVSLPGGHNFSFDAKKCIMTAAWKGDFLDRSEDLYNGGEGAKIAGELTYYNRDHFPIIEPAKGQPKFQGYRIFNGFPTFIYSTGLTKVKVRYAVKDGKLIQSFLIVNTNYVKYKKASGQKLSSLDGTDFKEDIAEKTQQPGKLMLVFDFVVGE
ncbi:MAG: hypothetical protein MK132_12685 [Lentisphaerales bacterium]|nr:hypothetical protein [Lentisphaerales bacterium]